MKKNKLILLLFISFLIFSCTEKKEKEQLPLIIRADSLSKTHKVNLTYDTVGGVVTKAEFIDPVDTTKKIEKLYYDNGMVYIEGETVNKLRNGLWKAWYDSGILWSIGNYVNGVKEGLEETFYPNGAVRYSIIYKNGKEDGIARYYSSKGDLIIEKVFKNGELISQKQGNEIKESDK